MRYGVFTFNPYAAQPKNSMPSHGVARDLQLPPGMQFVVDLRTGLPQETALLFVARSAKRVVYRRTGRFNPCTTDTYASCAAHLLNFMDQYGIDLDSMETEDLLAYAQHQLDHEKQSGEFLSFNTIRTRVGCSMRLLEFANLLGHAAVPFERAEIDCMIDQVERGAARSGAPGVLGLRAQRARLSRCMKWTDWLLISEKLGPRRRDCCSASSRNRLAGELATATGLRGLELASFPLSCVLGREVPSDGFVAVWVEVAKGASSRNVYVPAALFADLVHYAEGEAKEARAAGAARGARVDHDCLFVNAADAGAVAGEPVRTGTLQKAFRDACLKALPPIRCELPIGEDGSVGEVKAARHTLHDCRHSFAVWYYGHLTRELGLNEPWALLQAALGHKSVEVTKGTYVQLYRSLERDASDLLHSGLKFAERG